jgi:hypothetical protein
MCQVTKQARDPSNEQFTVQNLSQNLSSCQHSRGWQWTRS